MAKRTKHPQPPRDGIQFVTMWKSLVPRLTTRTDFDELLDLKNLEILCSLYEEEKKLTDILEVTGRFYETQTRNGTQMKTKPELTQLNTVRTQIRHYLQILRLVTMDKKSSVIGKTPDKKPSSDWE